MLLNRRNHWNTNTAKEITILTKGWERSNSEGTGNSQWGWMKYSSACWFFSLKFFRSQLKILNKQEILKCCKIYFHLKWRRSSDTNDTKKAGGVDILWSMLVFSPNKMIIKYYILSIPSKQNKRLGTSFWDFSHCNYWLNNIFKQIQSLKRLE